MSNHYPGMNPLSRIFLPEIDGAESLASLALDLRWSWNHAADEIWKRLDPELWEQTHNPWVILQTIPRDRLAGLLAEPGFKRRVDRLDEVRIRETSNPGWFGEHYGGDRIRGIAYFSMEYMLSEALPIYVGGLGNVAGDQLKAASDLGVPVTGIGLLYQQGYFRQIIDPDGNQKALFPYNDPSQLPIMPLRSPNGEWLRIRLALPGYSLWLRVWQVKVGRVFLYLLDSNDSANFPAHRGITSELYGGGPETRILQEFILGIGGWRLLRSLDLNPEICHMNEGHCAFAILERAREFKEQAACPFAVALAAIRSGNIFTTHTALAAGFDSFHQSLLQQYLGSYARQELGISIDELMDLGRQNPGSTEEWFHMAFLGIRGSASVNGVSRLHGEVSRKLLAPLFPRWPLPEVPVGHVTNGIHTPSWDSRESDRLWTDTCGKDRWRRQKENLPARIEATPDLAIWKMRQANREALVDYARIRHARQLAASGGQPVSGEPLNQLLDPLALTLGFARRFVPYKRTNLLIQDPDRFTRILCDPKRPVQLILAGKAGPFDPEGNNLILQWMAFIRRPELRNKVLFLSDYDMILTEHLVQGVDVWINTPRRPWEACGTSGMKVLVNGGLNLSELDGWWAEAYSPQVGWALGDGQDHGEDPDWDRREAEELYSLLEQQIVPEFFDRDSQGIPGSWVSRIRLSMAGLTARFSASRTVREYTEKHYLPAAEKYRHRSGDQGTRSAGLLTWMDHMRRNWPGIRFSPTRIRTEGGLHHFEVELRMPGLHPEEVQVELFANEPQGSQPFRLALNLSGTLMEAEVVSHYGGSVPDIRPASDYTVRVIPKKEGCAIPGELNLICWEK